jgi:hypothetical protein
MLNVSMLSVSIMSVNILSVNILSVSMLNVSMLKFNDVDTKSGPLMSFVSLLSPLLLWKWQALILLLNARIVFTA